MKVAPPSPRRFPWIRLIGGCGCLALLALGTCAVATWQGMGLLSHAARQGVDSLSRQVPATLQDAGREIERAAGTATELTEALLRARWRELGADLGKLATDEGVRELYRANPTLAARFGSEEAFLTRARQWRPKVQALAEDLPAWEQADATFKPFLDAGTPSLELAYTNRRGSRVRFVWKGSELSYIEVQ